MLYILINNIIILMLDCENITIDKYIYIIYININNSINIHIN